MLKPIKLNPEFKEIIWGGNKLKTDYNKVSDLKKEIKQYKKQIAALSAKLHIQKVIEMGNEEALVIVNNKMRNEELIKLRSENAKLRKDYRSIRDEFITLKHNIGKTGEQ